MIAALTKPIVNLTPLKLYNEGYVRFIKDGAIYLGENGVELTVGNGIQLKDVNGDYFKYTTEEDVYDLNIYIDGDRFFLEKNKFIYNIWCISNHIIFYFKFCVSFRCTRSPFGSWQVSLHSLARLHGVLAKVCDFVRSHYHYNNETHKRQVVATLKVAHIIKCDIYSVALP